MKRLLIGTGALFLMCAMGLDWSVTAASEKPLNLPDPLRYTCYRAAATIVIDGKLDEPSWKEAPESERFVDIADGSEMRYDTRAKLLWDDDHLYIGFTMEEPDIRGTLTERDSRVYHDDAVEMFFDPDGDGLHYIEYVINTLNTVYDVHWTSPGRTGGEKDLAWSFQGVCHAVHYRGTLNWPEDKDEGWTLELAFPWKAFAQYAGMPLPPEHGDEWRINFCRPEHIRGVSGGQNYMWSVHGEVQCHIPERFGTVRFSDKEVE